MNDARVAAKGIAWLVVTVAVLAFFAAAIGLFWQGDGPSFAFTTLRGDRVQVYGQGLYRFDTVMGGSGYRGVDLATLLVGLPLLAFSAVWRRRGSIRGTLLLVGALSYFLYDYASLALGAAYNRLFLVYVAIFAASLFALVLVLTTFDRAAFAASLSDRMPKRGIGAVLLATFGVLTAVWVLPAISAALVDEAPSVLASYTTVITWALDIGIILPLALLAGILVLRDRPLGYLIAAPILIVTLMLGPALTAMTVAQVIAGVAFTPAELIGPVAGFLVLSLVGMAGAIALLRNVGRDPGRMAATDPPGRHTAAANA
jgi:hypothetical protein